MKVNANGAVQCIDKLPKNLPKALFFQNHVSLQEFEDKTPLQRYMSHIAKRSDLCSGLIPSVMKISRCFFSVPSKPSVLPLSKTYDR